MVDFIVRDKKGSVLRGLTPDEVEVFEDGVRQRIENFQWVEDRSGSLVGGGESSPAAPGPAASGSPAVPDARYIALVLHSPTPKNKASATSAAAAWVSELRRPAWIGVFVVDQQLQTIQPFTDDRMAAVQGLERVGSFASAPVDINAMRERLRALHSRLGGGSPAAGVVQAEFAGPLFPGSGGLAPGEALRLGAEIRMLESMLETYGEQKGRAAVLALLALVNALGPVPGRKAIVLLSEGIPVTTAVQPLLSSVVAAANRSRVSLYTIDTAGLRTISTNEQMRREMLTIRQQMEQNEGSGSFATILRAEEMMRSSPESSLGALADETGGAFWRDTNDLGAGFRHIEEDLSGYYVLSYMPTNTAYDGRFRRIRLKVRRPHGSLQSRQGYLAVRTALPTPILAHEAPALAALERGQGPGSLPVRLSALDFPALGDGSSVVVLVEVEGRTLKREMVAGGYREDFTILALVRDREGRVVRKVAQRYEVSGPRERLERARSSSTLFYRVAELPPGPYRVDAVVWDAKAQAAGTVSTHLEVPPVPATEPRVGSLIVLRQVESIGPGSTVSRDHLLRYGDVLAYPNLGEPIPLGTIAELVFLLPVRAKHPLSAEVALRRGGEDLVRQTVKTPPPGEDGLIRLVGSVPIHGMLPGSYELRVSVDGGSRPPTKTRTVALTR